MSATPRPQMLVACDDHFLADLLVDLFRDEGYAVDWCRSGHDVLSALRQHPDRCVVLLSLRWPPLHSWAVLQAIAQEERLLERHACVLLTALWDFLSAEEHAFLRALGVPLVPKPFQLQTVLDAVAQATARLEDMPRP